jgi:hypothetical protein
MTTTRPSPHLVEPDAASVDYLLRLLTTSLRLGDARTLADSHEAEISNSPFPMVAFATACAVKQNFNRYVPPLFAL